MATVPCLYVPVVVATSGMRLRLTRNPAGAPGATTTNFDLAASTYTAPSGAGSIATAVQTAFIPLGSETVTVTVALDTGRTTIEVANLDPTTACSILWSTDSATQALGTALGFDVVASDTVISTAGGIATFPSDYAMPGYWTPGVPVRSSEPITEQDAVVNRTQGGQNTLDVLGRWPGKRVAIEWMPAAKTKRESETNTNESLERILTSDTYPAKFRWWTDRDTLGSGFDDYFFEPEVLQMVDPQRLSEAMPLYSVTFRMSEYVS